MITLLMRQNLIVFFSSGRRRCLLSTQESYVGAFVN